MPPPKNKPIATATTDLPDYNSFTGKSASASKGPPRRQNIMKSGNAGNKSSSIKPIIIDPLVPAAPPPLFPLGYKTPLSLLTERCQKMGWDKPNVQPKKAPSGSLWTASVELRRKNLKSGAMDTVYMRPPPAPSPFAVEKLTGLEAKHYAAVYALFRFANNLNLKMVLPPQVRPYWSALEAEKAASTPNKQWLWSLTPFETAAEAPPPPPSFTSSSTTSSSIPSHLASTNNSPFSSAPPSASTSRSATPTTNHSNSSRSDKHWNEAPEVRMPTALRDLVEETIRSMMIKFPNTSTSSSNIPSEFSEMSLSDLPPATLEDQQLLTELLQTGFRRGHILAAISYVHSARHSSTSDPLLRSLTSLPLRLAVLEYLHLHTPEEDLPAAFRGSRPPDASARLATNKDSDALAMSWKTEALAKETGMPIAIVEVAMRDAEFEEGVAVDLMVRRLMGWQEGEEGVGIGMSDTELLDSLEKTKVAGGMTKEFRKELEERRNDELEGLEGIFGDMCRRTEKGIEILVSSTKRINQDSTNEQVILRVLFHQHSLYPSPSEPNEAPHLPTFYVFSSTLPTYIRLHLTSLIASQFTSPDQSWLDLAQGGFGGIVCEMTSYLKEVWQEAVENPPDSRQVLSKLLGSKLGPSIESISSNKKKEVKSRNKSYRPPITPQAHSALLAHYQLNSKKLGYAAMLAVRENLPAWSMKDSIVDLIRSNRVVIVSGETGSGKTTQVPSFVLDDAIARGEGASINIIVTQPRRVSAIGVATRVGAERLEDINDVNSRFLIGYAIRGERKASKDCRILFCTTGVVLSRLTRGGDPDLADVSHIFIDEVHERSVDSDFLLLELRDILTRNKKLKVVLMSATINQAQFSNYFGGAPCIEIPGFTHPVQDHYLEEILPHLTNYQSTSKPAKKATAAQLERMKESFISRGVTNERTLMALEALTRSERIDYNLLGATAAYCLERSKGTQGGVLVFMPGVFEIKQAVDAIRAACPSSERIEVFPLHANLSSQEQTAVFRPVKSGHRKVVVATNVAETSITIDGIVYVIDCGRVKENTFDPESGIVKLVETWTSKAASRQRRGRAGRTRPGECFKLFTHYTEENNMANHPTPEIVRIPLESLCLQIKAMREDEDVKTFLGKALDPPDVRAIDSAWTTLRLLGAIESEGGTAARLTPLGAHLAMIPVDLRLGKMLVLAAIFSCLDPILTVVAMLSSKPFFLNPMDKRDEAKKARSMFYTSRSDLLSDVKAYEACLAARNRSNSDLRIFAEDNFISLSTFRDVQNLRNDYLTALSDVGFIPFRASPTSNALNANASNENLLKTVIFAGTGRLVKVKLPDAVFDKGLSGAIERDRLSKEVKFFEKDGRVFLHPGSLLFTENRYATPYVTFWGKQVTTKPFLRDATEVPLYGVLLFGQKVQVDLQKGLTIGEDNWLMMRAWPRIGVLVNQLRRLFDADLENNIESPDFENTTSSPVVKAILALLEKDGGLY